MTEPWEECNVEPHQNPPGKPQNAGYELEHPGGPSQSQLQLIVDRFAWTTGELPAWTEGQPSQFKLVRHVSSGHSAAQIWRVVDEASGVPHWCLRRWPRQKPSPEHLLWIHHQLELASTKCSFINLPVKVRTIESGMFRSVPLCADARNTEGSTIISSHRFHYEQDHCWQLEPWVHAGNDFLQTPRPVRLDNAMRALGHLHAVWSECSNTKTRTGSFGACLAEAEPMPPNGISPAIRSRWEQLGWWWTHGTTRLLEIEQSLDKIDWAKTERDAWRELTRQVHAVWHKDKKRMIDRIRLDLERTVRLFTVLGDVWSDHLFFEGDRLVKIIDYGGVRIDTASVDLARLLASTCGTDENRRTRAIAAYETVRELQPNERHLIESLSDSARLLGPLNWLNWIFIDRSFAPKPTLLNRIIALLKGGPF